VSAARIRIGALVLFAGLAPAAIAAVPGQPTVTLLAPANGVLVDGEAPTFAWRIDAPSTPPSGTITVTHRVGTDLALTQDVTTTTRSCSASNLSCWTSFRPTRSYAGRRYWQVSVSGAMTASSPRWMFQGVAKNPGLDRSRPAVRAYPGAGQRGRKAVFVARVADDRGEARMRVDLLYRNQLVIRAMTLLKPVRWSVKQRFDSRAPLARSLYPGAYRVCVTAWDRTGNQARSCARYLVR
jgi:hypothetical protein